MDLEAEVGVAFCALASVPDLGFPGCCTAVWTQGMWLLFSMSADKKASHPDFVTSVFCNSLPTVHKTQLMCSEWMLSGAVQWLCTKVHWGSGVRQDPSGRQGWSKTRLTLRGSSILRKVNVAPLLVLLGTQWHDQQWGPFSEKIWQFPAAKRLTGQGGPHERTLEWAVIRGDAEQPIPLWNTPHLSGLHLPAQTQTDATSHLRGTVTPASWGSFSGRSVQKPTWTPLPAPSPSCHLLSPSLASPSYWCTHTHNLAARRVVPWAAVQASPGTLSELYNLGVHPKPVEWESAFSWDLWWFECTFKVWETLC